MREAFFIIFLFQSFLALTIMRAKEKGDNKNTREIPKKKKKKRMNKNNNEKNNNNCRNAKYQQPTNTGRHEK